MKLTEKQIAAYEAKGFRRWTKGNMDRLYVNVQQLGAEVDYYNTGNVRHAEWQGEQVSNADGRRLIASKVWVDVETGELHVRTDFAFGHCDIKTIEEAAREYVDAIDAELNDETEDDDAEARRTRLVDAVMSYVSGRINEVACMLSEEDHKKFAKASMAARDKTVGKISAASAGELFTMSENPIELIKAYGM